MNNAAERPVPQNARANGHCSTRRSSLSRRTQALRAYRPAEPLEAIEEGAEGEVGSAGAVEGVLSATLDPKEMLSGHLGDQVTLLRCDPAEQVHVASWAGLAGEGKATLSGN